MSFTPRNRSRPFSYKSFRSVGNKGLSTNNNPNYNPFSDGYSIKLNLKAFLLNTKLFDFITNQTMFFSQTMPIIRKPVVYL